MSVKPSIYIRNSKRSDLGGCPKCPHEYSIVTDEEVLSKRIVYSESSCFLGPHANFQKSRSTPSWRKLKTSEVIRRRSTVACLV